MIWWARFVGCVVFSDAPLSRPRETDLLGRDHLGPPSTRVEEASSNYHRQVVRVAKREAGAPVGIQEQQEEPKRGADDRALAHVERGLERWRC